VLDTMAHPARWPLSRAGRLTAGARAWPAPGLAGRCGRCC